MTVTPDDIRRARERIRGVVRPTPLDRSDTLSRIVGRPVALKPEHLQRTGSFKIRGAVNFVARLPAGTEAVAASAGNHAQGVALAAARTGLRSTIFMPRVAALPKVEATRNYGGTVHLAGETVDDAIAAGRAYAAGAEDRVFVPPFDDPDVIAGQGTIGLEIAEEAPDAEVVIVPVGGGGTMADGIAVKGPSPLTLEHVQKYVAEIVTVDEGDISRAVVLLLERAKAVVEPAGAVGLAALLAGKIAGDGLAVVVLSGGNVDPFLLMQLVDRGLSASGRYLILRVLLHDRPGALAALTTAVAGMGLNVLSVEHHRAGLTLPLADVEVVLTLETRDPAHRDEVVAQLRSAGFTAERVG